jgi:hypothetical protein
LDGKVFDRETLEELSKEGVTLVSLQDYVICCHIDIVFTWELNRFQFVEEIVVFVGPTYENMPSECM